MKKCNTVDIDVLIEKANEYLKQEDSENKIRKAYEFAKKVHNDNKLSNGDDYITHPLNVALILTEIYTDLNTIITSLLHDTVNVGNTTIKEITDIFGEEVAELVNGVSKINKLSLSTESEAIISYHKKILVGLSGDVRIIIIKLADTLHNMRTLYSLSTKEQKEKAKETLEILVPIAHRLGVQKIKGELEDLSLKYYKPEVYNDILEKLNCERSNLDLAVDTMLNQVSKILSSHGIKHEMKGRTKSVYSIYSKLSKGRMFNDIYDILALRFLVNTEQDCYIAMGLIHAKFKPITKRFKDFVARPKENLYQSLHTTVFGAEGRLFEIQIRTFQMDKLAEYGVASHWSYKENNTKIDSMEQKLKIFRDIIELNEDQTSNEDFVKSVKEDIFTDNNIYVYTPKGDVIELPKGSTPIDFAYRVHSRIGDTMVGAIVNNTIVPLSYVINDGDIIKINVNNASKGPSKEWINIAYTIGAKNKIKNYYIKKYKTSNIEKGKELIQALLIKNKLSYNLLFTKKNIAFLIKELKLDKLDDVFYYVATNKYSATAIINILNSNNIINDQEAKINTYIKKQGFVDINNEIIVAGVNGIKVNLASCCKPIKGDKIIGYVSRGKGIIVHRKECNNVASTSDRTIEVCWSQGLEEKLPVELKIMAENNKNILLDIMAKTSSLDITLTSINTNANKYDTAYDIIINVLDDLELKKYINSIMNISGIIEIERTFN